MGIIMGLGSQSNRLVLFHSCVSIAMGIIMGLGSQSNPLVLFQSCVSIAMGIIMGLGTQLNLKVHILYLIQYSNECHYGYQLTAKSNNHNKTFLAMRIIIVSAHSRIWYCICNACSSISIDIVMGLGSRSERCSFYTCSSIMMGIIIGIGSRTNSCVIRAQTHKNYFWHVVLIQSFPVRWIHYFRIEWNEGLSIWRSSQMLKSLSRFDTKKDWWHLKC